jgi:hypothetical protein
MDDSGVVIVDLGPYQPADMDAIRRLQKGARAPIIVLSGRVSGTGPGGQGALPRPGRTGPNRGHGD